MDNEKENFKTGLKKSFNEISLPVHIPGRLKDILEEKKKENFAKFDGATKDVHKESEYKRNEKSELESFANEKINEMMEKNKGICFYLYDSLYNVSSCQGRKHRSAICVVSNEPIFKVHILFFSDIYSF